MFNDDKPVVAAISPRLIGIFRDMQEELDSITGRKAKGGLTAYSEMVAYQMELLRSSSDRILKDILKLHETPISKFKENGVVREYVPYEYFKKLFILTSVLNKKKDQQQLHVEVTKIKGLQKNEIRYLW